MYVPGRAYTVGDVIAVTYNPNEPTNAGPAPFGTFQFHSAAFGTLGVAMITGGIVWIGRRHRRRRLRERLRAEGQPVRAEIEAIYPYTSYIHYNRPRWRIGARRHDTVIDRMYLYESEDIWFDPNDFVEVGGGVTVYEKDGDYVMEVDGLPQTA